MLCNMLGVKKFQEGLRIYLKRYQYKNAETVDLWDALSETSGLVCWHINFLCFSDFLLQLLLFAYALGTAILKICLKFLFKFI